MADCPGVLHLALMADGGLARLRTPGGLLSADQARAVADAAERLGSGVIDLTNRANLQIRGLAPDAGLALAAALAAAGFGFDGPSERRRNILLDPLSGLDPQERRDMRPMAEALDAALKAAPWIGDLSPKFAFVFDGGGSSTIGAAPSDVFALAQANGIVIVAGQAAALVTTEDAAVAAIMAVARAAADAGPDIRVRDLPAATLAGALAATPGVAPFDAVSRPAEVVPRFGSVDTRDGLCAVCLPVPVGRLDATMMRFLADEAEREGCGGLRLAPWSGAVLPGVRPDRAAPLLARSESAGFLPVAVAERLTIIACAGAPACERAREPAKALGAAVLTLAAANLSRLPSIQTRLHLSACPKGCAGSTPADLLLLGSSDAPGWSLHRGGAPRAPGPVSARLDGPDPAEVLALVAARN